MVLFLAALQQVDKNLYEASYLDGANKWKQFQHVTLPMITPTVFFFDPNFNDYWFHEGIWANLCDD